MSLTDHTALPPFPTYGAEEPKTNWFRPLKGDRMEVYLVGETEDGVPIKVRASGAETPMWRIVEMFEEMTGKEVVGGWKRPPRTGARPLAGQLSITEALDAD